MKDMIRLNFVDPINRVEYLKGNLAIIGICIGALFVSTIGVNLQPEVQSSVYTSTQGAFNILGSLFVAVAVAMFVWCLPLQVSLVTRRFRHIGMNDTGTLIGAVTLQCIAQAVFAPIGLLPLLWKGKETVSA